MKNNTLSKRRNIGFSLYANCFIIFLMLCTLNANAIECNKTQEITLSQKRISLKQLFNEISSQSEYNFFYENSEIDTSQKVDLIPRKQCVKSILINLQNSSRYKFKVIDNQIIITHNEGSKSSDIIVGNKASKKKLQDRKVSGTVFDDTGFPLPGASILVKGTTRGVTTDFDGKFVIEIPSGSETLIISYLGFNTQEVNITGKSTVTINLVADASALEEIIIIGYGSLAKKRVTGSVISVSTKQLAELPVLSAEGAIIGQVAGVQIQETTGEPGASSNVRIRGTASIGAGSDPLFVVDGIPISKNLTQTGVQSGPSTRRADFRAPQANPLATINPNDIASIEILKDASASAIYGSRGNNGVILITTKRNSGTDEGVFSFNSYFGLQTVANKIDLMNSEELIAYTTDARNNNYLASVPGSSISDPIGPGQRGNENYELPQSFIDWDGTDTDWQNLLFRTAQVKNYNLSYGAKIDEKTSFYSSLGYYSQEGIIAGSKFDRYNLLLNLNSKLTEKLSLDVKVAPTITDNNRLPVSSPYFARPPGIVYSALVHSPTVKPYNADGTPNQTNNQSHLGGGTTSASNPLAIRDAISDNLRQFQIQSSVGLSYKITPELIFKTFGGLYLNNYANDFYRANSLLYREATEGESFGQSLASSELNWLWENTLNWEKEIDDHYFNAVAGYTAQKDRITSTLVLANNFPDDLVRTVSGGQVFGGTATKEEWSLASALLRLNYSYKDKYLFTGTIRSDKSSRFGMNNRIGYFPSFSVGWRINEENFMESFEAISNLKLKVSWGQTGNFEIPNYGSIGLLDPENYNFNRDESNGLIQSTISNPDLTWEKSTQVDVGLELGLFGGRISMLADYYRTLTSDLLLNVAVSSVSGFTTSLQNLGEVENKGFEIALRSKNLVGDFKWETDFNISFNKNEVLSLNNDNEPIFSAGGAGIRHVTRVGDAVGSYYGYVVDGVYQSQAEIDAAPLDTQAPNPASGDFRFKDINGDGQITPDDRTVTGSYFPDYTWGITNRFFYKGFDLSVLLQGVQGNEILNLTSRHLKNGEANFNSYAVLNNRWQSAEAPGNGSTPRADRETGNHGNNNRPSSYQVENGSFWRLRNVSLGYSIPTDKLFGDKIDKLRIYVTGTNIFTETNYLGYNPEVSNNLNPLTPGEDYGTYPLTKSITFGINLNF